MIQVEHISKKFGDFPVLKDISFCADEGAIYGLIGYNGVGKTTLMKIISGIYRPDAGTVRINGEPVYENASVKKQCFFMTEEATYFSQASLMQMRRFYRGYYENWSDHTFQGLIRLFGVDPNMKISRFSILFINPLSIQQSHCYRLCLQQQLYGNYTVPAFFHDTFPL